MINEQAQQENLEKQARMRRDFAQAFVDTFTSPQGKKVLDWLEKFCRADTTTFTPEDPSGRISAFKEGRREVILEIRKFLADSQQQTQGE